MQDHSSSFNVPEPESVIAGKYQVVRHIGDGGMGSVVEARNLLTGKRVAVKCMLPDIAARPDAVQRFIEEAQVCTRVQHPNVVDVLDLIQDDSSVFIVMELLEGESLRAFMSNATAEPHELVAILLEAMQAVRAAHSQGIIHRDIKPENIFLARQAYGPARKVKVLDFGLSKPIYDRARVRLSRVGEPMGTLHYMSREQLNGVHDVDARTDVYAFGVMLYEGLSGQVPYPADTIAELAVQFDQLEPRSLHSIALWANVPRPLEALVMRAIACDRDARIPSLDVMLAGLKPYADTAAWGAPRAKPEQHSRVVPRRPRREEPPPQLSAATEAPRESYPSLPSVDSSARDLPLSIAFAAAVRGDLRVSSAVALMARACTDFVLTVGTTSWRLLASLFSAPASRRRMGRTYTSSAKLGVFRLLGRLIWAATQLVLSIVLTAFVVVWNAAQALVETIIYAIDFLRSFGSTTGRSSTASLVSSRHAKQLLALVVMCAGIYFLALWRARLAARETDGPHPVALTINADPPDPRAE
jgi:serine/threonine-protein kinase